MAKRITDRQLLALKLDTLPDSEFTALLEYLTVREVNRRSANLPGTQDDDVVSVLVEARENRRARQAFEWELVRRRAERGLRSGIR